PATARSRRLGSVARIALSRCGSRSAPGPRRFAGGLLTPTGRALPRRGTTRDGRGGDRRHHVEGTAAAGRRGRRGPSSTGPVLRESEHSGGGAERPPDRRGRPIPPQAVRPPTGPRLIRA